MKTVSEETVADLATITSFLLWYQREDPGAMWGSYTIDEAIESFSRLTGFSVEHLKSISGVNND